MSDTEPLVTPLTIALVSPVDGITQVTLREMTVDEIARLNDESHKFGPIRAMKNLISAMAGIEAATVGKMGTRDFNACTDYLNSFSSKSPAESA
jgi:hypothetical protein